MGKVIRPGYSKLTMYVREHLAQALRDYTEVTGQSQGDVLETKTLKEIAERMARIKTK